MGASSHVQLLQFVSMGERLTDKPRCPENKHCTVETGRPPSVLASLTTRPTFTDSSRKQPLCKSKLDSWQG